MLRAASIADLATLRRLYDAMRAEDPDPFPLVDAEEMATWTVLLAKQLAGNVDHFGCWLAFPDDACQESAVGFLAIEHHARLFGKPHSLIVGMAMYVDPLHRHTGHAQRLTAAATAWAITRGLQPTDTVELTTRHGDDAWTRRGWTPYGTLYYIPFGEIVARFLAPPSPVEESSNGLSFDLPSIRSESLSPVDRLPVRSDAVEAGEELQEPIRHPPDPRARV